jgi:hypothetical protein
MLAIPITLLLVSSPPYVGIERPVTDAIPAPWGGQSDGNWEIPPIGVDFDGTNHLVVWADHRTNTLIAARVSPSGMVLEPTGVAIRAGAVPQILPGHLALAFDGTQHLVVFAQLTTRGSYVDDEIVAIRLSTDLRVIDSVPIVISEQAIPLAPAVSFDGTQFVVAWSAGDAPSLTGSNTARFYARVTRDGRVLDPGGVMIEGGLEPGYGPGRVSIASAGGITAIAWQIAIPIPNMLPAYHCRFRRLRSNGTWLDDASIDLGNPTDYPCLPQIGSNSNGFLATWLDAHYRNGFVITPSVQRIPLEGPVTTSPIRLESGAGELYDAGVAIGRTLSEWHVVWTRAGDTTRGVRISDSGTASPIVTLPDIPTPRWPVLSWNGQSQLLVTSSYEDLGNSFVRARRLTPELGALEMSPIDVNRAAPAQWSPVIAGGERQALAVWHESRGAWPANVRAARVNEDGSSLDPNGIDVSRAAYEGGGFVNPAASWNGTDYVVAWVDRRGGRSTYEDVYAARVSPGGVVLDPSGIPVRIGPSTEYDVAVASLPTGLSLVCWRESAPGFVHCSRLDVNGQILDPSMGVRVSAQEAAALAVAAIGGRFFVVWTTPASLAPGLVLLRSFDPATAALGSLVSVSSDSYWPERPAFFGGERDGQLVWERAIGDLRSVGLSAAIVSDSGAVSAIESVTARGSRPVVAFARGEWMIGWIEEASSARQRYMVRRRAIDGTFLDTELLVQEGFPISDLGLAGMGDRFVAAYQRFIEEPSVLNVRTMTRVLSDTPIIGEPDAGSRDGEAPDADPAVDGGLFTPDAGLAADALPPQASPDASIGRCSSGCERTIGRDDCSCTSTEPGRGGLASALLVLGLCLRRCRHRLSAHPSARLCGPRTSRVQRRARAR